MDANDAMNEQPRQDHVEPPPTAQQQVSADIENNHGIVGLPQNTDTMDNHLRTSDVGGRQSATAQEQGIAGGWQDGQVQPETSSTGPGQAREQLMKHAESNNAAPRDGTHGQDTTSEIAAQAQPREVSVKPILNDPSTSAVHDHTAPTTTSDENKYPSTSDDLLPAEASGTQPPANTPELLRGNPYMLSGSVAAADQDTLAAKADIADAKSVEDHDHLSDAEPEAADEGGKGDGSALGGEDDSIKETTAEPEGEQNDEEEENDEEDEGEDGEEAQGGDDYDDAEDDNFLRMQAQLEEKVARSRAKLAAAGFQHSHQTPVDSRSTQNAHGSNVHESGIYSGLRQTQQQPRQGYHQGGYDAPIIPGYGNNMPGGQHSRPFLSSYGVPGYETRPMFDDYPHDPMNMRPSSQMRPPHPYHGRAPSYQHQTSHERSDMFFGHPTPRQVLYERDPYPQNYHPGEDPIMYGTSGYQQVQPRVPAPANRMPSQAPAYMPPPRAQRLALRQVVEDDGTDDDEPLRSRVQRHPSAVGEPAKGATRAGKKGQSDKDEDVQFVSAQPKMGFKPPKTKKATPKKTSEPPPFAPTPAADPAQPTEPTDPAQVEPDDTSIEFIDWTLPRYDATFEPPTTKDDPTVAKISLPGLYREELLLSPDHPEQETHLLLNIFMPAQQALAASDPEPAIAILNFHTLAVMCIEAYVQFEIGDELGTGRGHWHDEYDRSDKEYRRLRDAKDADPDEIFCAVIDRWRAGVESNKKGAKMIRGVQEFCDTVLDIVYYIKENGLWRKEMEKEKGGKKGGDDGTEGEEGGKGTKRKAGKVNELKVTKKAKTEKKTPAKKAKKKNEPGLMVIPRK